METGIINDWPLINPDLLKAVIDETATMWTD